MNGRKLLVLVVLLAVFGALVVVLRPREKTEGPTPPAGAAGKVAAPPPRTPPPPGDPLKLLRWGMDYAAYGEDAVEAGATLEGPAAREILEAALARDEEEYEDEDLAIRALYVLAGRGAEGVVGKIRQCLDENDWDWVGEWAGKALARVEGEEALVVLLKLAQSDEEEARQAAAIALAGRRDPRARDAVKSLLTDEDDEVRATAAGVLVAFGDPGAGAAVEAVLEEEDEFMDAALARGLGIAGNSAGLPWLDRILAREDEDARMAAARALGAIRDAGGVARLEKLLRDDSPEVAAVAAATLARDFGRVSCADALETAVRELRDPEIRTEALRALIRLGREEDRPFFREIYDHPFPAGAGEPERQAHLVVKFWAAHALLGGR